MPECEYDAVVLSSTVCESFSAVWLIDGMDGDGTTLVVTDAVVDIDGEYLRCDAVIEIDGDVDLNELPDNENVSVLGGPAINDVAHLGMVGDTPPPRVFVVPSTPVMNLPRAANHRMNFTSVPGNSRKPEFTGLQQPVSLRDPHHAVTGSAANAVVAQAEVVVRLSTGVTDPVQPAFGPAMPKTAAVLMQPPGHGVEEAKAFIEEPFDTTSKLPLAQVDARNPTATATTAAAAEPWPPELLALLMQ